MNKSIFDINYENKLSLFETQVAIKFVKDTFQKELIKELDLVRVTAPLFVVSNSGLNDNLSGVEKPVSFNVPYINENVEIIHSLAKWKRKALFDYGFDMYKGLYTDMNAIRKDEKLDFYHSIYVDQWDWEKIIKKEDRNIEYLKFIVNKIYRAIYNLELEVSKKYPSLKRELPNDIYFISSEELENRYPTLSRKERENQITREYKAVFLYRIGYSLKDGKPHDSRAPDYDDWMLNGDILVHYELYDMAFELSSMGIRVDADSLVKQVKYLSKDTMLDNDYCKMILNEELPYTIGGGIGQSRLCMYMLKKAHIGEVQSSIWGEKERKLLKEKNINLL